MTDRANSSQRILLLITDLQIGGTPTVVRELAKRLAEDSRFHVEVACLSEWEPVADEIRAAGIEVTALGARSWRDAPRTLLKLTRLIRTRRFDTVFSFLIHANAFAAASSLFCPGVHYLQSIQTTQERPAWHWRVQALVHHAVQTVVVPSPSVADAARRLSNIPLQKIRVIPNAVEIEEFAVIQSPPIDTTRPVPIGFIGRLDPIKRVPDLVEAVHQVNGLVHLRVFGAGPEQANIQATIDRLNVAQSVTLHGAIRRPREALEKISLLVLPSEAEGFGLVLIEAMAAGVPVIASDVAGIRDVVQNGFNGLLFRCGSSSELADAIRRVIDDVNLRHELIKNGIGTARSRFSWEIVMEQYQALLSTAE